MAKRKKKSVPKQAVSAKEAAEVLAKDEQDRVTRCVARVNKVLEEDGCKLVTSIQGNNISGVQFTSTIVANPGPGVGLTEQNYWKSS